MVIYRSKYETPRFRRLFRRHRRAGGKYAHATMDHAVYVRYTIQNFIYNRDTTACYPCTKSIIGMADGNNEAWREIDAVDEK